MLGPVRGAHHNGVRSKLLTEPQVSAVSHLANHHHHPSHHHHRRYNRNQHRNSADEIHALAAVIRSCTAHYFCTHASVCAASTAQRPAAGPTLSALRHGRDGWVCTATPARKRWWWWQQTAVSASGTPVAVSTEWARLGARVSKGPLQTSHDGVGLQFFSRLLARSDPPSLSVILSVAPVLILFCCRLLSPSLQRSLVLLSPKDNIG